MKLLKLDARFEDARRVARCLVGSVADESWHKEITKDPKLAYIDDGYFVILFWDVTGMDFEIKHTILLPIDTLKFCPYVAMREGVEVFHQETNQCGLIESIICGREVWLTQEGDEPSIPFGVNDLKLGLYQIERGELEGCEIVEVGE